MKLGLCLILFSFTALAGVQELLPPPLREFVLHKTTKQEVDKSLGKAQLIEGSDHYWVRDGLKYAIKISYDQQSKISSLHFTYTKNKPDIESLNIKDTKKLLPYPASGRSAGRFLIHQEKNAQIIIDPLSKTIYSVELK